MCVFYLLFFVKLYVYMTIFRVYIHIYTHYSGYIMNFSFYFFIIKVVEKKIHNIFKKKINFLYTNNEFKMKN